jgi:hypothetical protein
MRPPRDPTRRSRNLGTARQGHGADNALGIPHSLADDRVYYEVLRNPRVYSFEVHGTMRVALVEPAADGYLYGCTVPDLARLLSLLPVGDLDGLDLFLFRQPKRKQRILRPVWGRFIYYASPGGGSGRHEGAAICFESQALGVVKWPRSMTPADVRELARLRADGHAVSPHKRTFDLTITAASLRSTTLYRTALHEIGHYVDWLRSVLAVTGSDAEVEAAERAFETKPTAMKEDFAHRYAIEVSARLRDDGQLPFALCWDDEGMEKAGIERRWFVDADGGHPIRHDQRL